MSTPKVTDTLDAASLAAQVRALRQELDDARAQLEEADSRSRELESEVAQRGVKLSCARIALARAKIAFDETTRHREELVQDVAHDLRTPLTSIKGAAQNLLDGVAGPLGADAHEYVDIVREHADRLIGAVNWLVEVMRVNSSPGEVDVSELDVAEIAASVVHGLGPIAREKGVALELARSAAVARVDGPRVRQVLENLIGNALKFTGPGGHIDVEVGSLENDIQFAVRDTGVGMDAETRDRIFERYFRKQRAPGSSGLGLVICREIVRLHGGEIRVWSEPCEGSEFRVRLPKDGSSIDIAC